MRSEKEDGRRSISGSNLQPINFVHARRAKKSRRAATLLYFSLTTKGENARQRKRKRSSGGRKKIINWSMVMKIGS